MNDLTRREFLAASAAIGAACAFGGCAAVNSAPSYEAAADGTLPWPAALDTGQVKVKLADGTRVLVWKHGEALSAVSIQCTHRGSEVAWNAEVQALECPSHGSRYAADGTVTKGPAKKALRRYVAAREGDRLRVGPA